MDCGGVGVRGIDAERRGGLVVLIDRSRVDAIGAATDHERAARFRGKAVRVDDTADGNGLFFGEIPDVGHLAFFVAGFGFLDVGKSAQEYIDRGDQAILQNLLFNARPRHFIRADGAVNEEEFADAARDFIHVDGNLGSDSILPVQPNPLNQIYVTILENKIQELKETTGNRDVSTGGTTGGATAASAIAAMQEAGSKLTRDCSMGSYRAFRKVLLLCIELIRQFYDVPRCFRILGEGGAEDFVRYSNRRLRLQETRGEQGWHLPLFDIRVTAEKQSPYSKMAQNELALQLYGAGFFAPQNAQAALSCLDMMDFEGKDFVQRSIRENADKAARSVELTGEPGPEDIRAGQAPGVLQARLRVAEAGAPR